MYTSVRDDSLSFLQLKEGLTVTTTRNARDYATSNLDVMIVIQSMLYGRILGMLRNSKYDMLLDSEWLGYLNEGIGYLPKETGFKEK